MKPCKVSALEAKVSELKTLVNNLLDKIEKQDARIRKLTTENPALRGEVQHLKKLKGQPKIRLNKKAPEDSKDNKTDATPAHTAPPKNKHPRSQKTGQTARPSPSSIQDKICKAEGV